MVRKEYLMMKITTIQNKLIYIDGCDKVGCFFWSEGDCYKLIGNFKLIRFFFTVKKLFEETRQYILQFCPKL